MKKCILLSLILASTSAFASKARVGALMGADHLVDTQTVFTNPAHVGLLNPYITFEMGAAGTQAEGGIMRSLNNGGKILVYLGHQNTTGLSAFNPDIRTGAGYISQQNPLEVLYATGNMGFGASLSNFEDKKAGTKETTLVLKFGQNLGNISWYGHLSTLEKAEKNTAAANADSLTVGPRLTLGAAHDDGRHRYYGSFVYGDAKNKLGAAPEVSAKDTAIKLGWEDRTLATQASDIYYGLRLEYGQRDLAGNKRTSYALPATLGIEHSVTSWATFRGSVQQNILLGQSKDEAAAAPADEPSGVAANTTVAAGLGLKYGNLALDGMLSAGTSGQVNGTSFLTNAAVTYNF